MIMKLWMLPWLFPVGLLGIVVFVSVAGRYAGLAAIVIGMVVAPVVWVVHFAPSGESADTQYWRFRRR